MGQSEKNEEAKRNMGRVLKYLIYLILLGFIALVAYAYVGPFVGADFSAPQTEQREPITLEAE